MKLSDLSPREHIALEVYPSLVATGKLTANEAAWLAFGHADAFLKRVGRENDKVAEIKRECDGGDFTARVALTQIWELLGVDNQTAAMAKLRDMVEVMNFLEGPDHATLMERLRLARMEHSI